MRKSLFTFLLVLLIIFNIPLNIKASSYNYVKSELKEYYIIPENLKEKLYQDILMTLLLPILQNTVNNYYREYLSVSPMVALMTFLY